MKKSPPTTRAAPGHPRALEQVVGCVDDVGLVEQDTAQVRVAGEDGREQRAAAAPDVDDGGEPAEVVGVDDGPATAVDSAVIAWSKISCSSGCSARYCQIEVPCSAAKEFSPVRTLCRRWAQACQ